MSPYRHNLPQLAAGTRPFMTEAGLETTLIYDDGIELPDFAAFRLLDDAAGIEVLRRYYLRFARLAARLRCGAVFETPTWRASADWGARLGYDAAALDRVNRKAVELLRSLAPAGGEPTDADGEVDDDTDAVAPPIVVSGCIGPRGDGYVPGRRMSAQDAQHYHGAQIATFASTDADLVSVLTMTYVDEAIGVVRAAREHAMPVVVSFTLETDGRLPSGQPLADAIEQTDAATGAYPTYYMINCAHPAHFPDALRDGAGWTRRIGGVRANASRRSHAELDAATELDSGDPVALGGEYVALRARLPGLRVVGGCCGTDHRHVEAICRALGGRSAAAPDGRPGSVVKSPSA